MTLDYDKIAAQAAKRGSTMAPASGGEEAHTEYEASLNQESEQMQKAKPSALQQARGAWHDAQHYYDVAEEKDGNAFYRSMAAACEDRAATLAAIAQAESLERIANAVERLVSDAKQREGEL